MFINLIIKLYYWKCQIFSKKSFTQETILGTRVLSEYEWKREIIKNFFTSEIKWNKRKMIDTLHVNKIAKINKIEISVLISIYKSGKYLKGFLQNILEQTYFLKSEFIFILVNPTKEELKYINALCSIHGNCKLIVSQDKISIYDAWNKAINISSANLLTNMNVDDLRSPMSLEIQVDFMNKNENVDVGYQDILFFRDLKSSWSYIEKQNFRTNLPEVSVTCLAWLGINPPHNAPVWRKNLHRYYGVFDSSFASAGDYEFWLRISIEGARFKKMNELHVGYYVNQTGMSTKSDSPSSREEKVIQDKYKKRYMETAKIPKSFFDNQYFELLCDYLGDVKLKDYYRKLNL